MVRKLTEKQSHLLRYLADYRLKYGNQPTLKEMARGSGLSDHKSVSRTITALIERGYVERGLQRTRAILLTDQAYEFLGVPLLRRQFAQPGLTPIQESHLQATETVLSAPAPDFSAFGSQSIQVNGTNSPEDPLVKMASVWWQSAHRTDITKPIGWGVAIPLMVWLLSAIGFSMPIAFMAALLCAWFIKNYL